MILIFTDEINPRVEYATQLIFRTILQTERRLITDSVTFISSDLPKLNYSKTKFGGEIYLKPHSLLFEKKIITPELQPVRFKEEKYFFASSPDSILPFDLFAAAFYLVTRFEEYNSAERDQHQRYPATQSILFKLNLLKKPVVNIWANLLAEKLQEKFPRLAFPERKFKFNPTIDIDNAWAFLHKGFIRSAGATVKNIAKSNYREIRKQFKVLAGSEKDPYDSYQYLDSVFKGNEEQVTFFFLLGDYRPFDKNISHKNRYLKKLIRTTAEKYSVGIHPSYASGSYKNSSKLRKEIRRLEKITGKKVEKSRQHFLKLTIPESYSRLIKLGITEDFTMGYPSHTGFRAGICTPFHFYDLKNESETNLRIYPFQTMDVTLRDYLRLSPGEALEQTEELMREVKNVGGTFTSIWHNESVNNRAHWRGYQLIFQEMNKLGFKWANE